MDTVYLITNSGLELLVGKDGDVTREKILEKENVLDYQFYDDDKKTWGLWAVQDGEDVKPLSFLPPEKYGVTSAELFSQTVTYPAVLAQVIEIITRKAQSIWDKLMKPATLITAIIFIIAIIAVVIVAIQG